MVKLKQLNIKQALFPQFQKKENKTVVTVDKVGQSLELCSLKFEQM